MKKKIMILGASILQLPAIIKAKELGYDVVALDMNPHAIGFDVDGIYKEVVSTIDIPAAIEAAKKHKINGVMTLASDMPMRTAAAIAKEMNLVGITEECALKATNKAEMRRALSEYGVPVPLFYKISNREQFLNVVNCFKDNFIIKPADNSGSRGVVKASPFDDKESLLCKYEYSKLSSRNGDVVVEEFMDGPEVSVETLSIDGVCHVIQITDKLTTGAPHFVEMGHSQPSSLNEEIKEKIKKVAVDANKAIGIVNGPSHTEIIVTKDGPKIVEIGARLGGDCITTHLVPLSTGVNMVECCIKIALGEKPNITNTLNNGSAIRYFKQKEGKILSIDGVEHAKQMKGIKEISFVYKIGDRISDIENSASRLGFVIAQDSDAKSAIEDCENALNSIRIEIGD